MIQPPASKPAANEHTTACSPAPDRQNLPLPAPAQHGLGSAEDACATGFTVAASHESDKAGAPAGCWTGRAKLDALLARGAAEFVYAEFRARQCPHERLTHGRWATECRACVMDLIVEIRAAARRTTLSELVAVFDGCSDVRGADAIRALSGP